MSYSGSNSKIDSIKKDILAIQDYIETSRQEKELLKNSGDSLAKATSEVSQQLKNISEKQKRFQREGKNSFENLLDFIGMTNGTGSQSLKYIRKKILEVSVRIEPKIKEIFAEETIKLLGCSEEQTYPGVSKENLELQPLPLRPTQEGIYIPIQQLDLFQSLKFSPESIFGKIYYEFETPNTTTNFINFGGGADKFPMNKEIYNRTTYDNLNRSFRTEYGNFYQGASQKPLFDFQYTKTNEFGVTGDFIRVMLIDRENIGSQGNKMLEFVKDYYDSIKLIEPSDIGGKLVNILFGAVNIEANFGLSQIQEQNKFNLILQRILGLCFDSRKEIDVSGISKVAELDGVDDSFFELNEVDLRKIDIESSLVLSKVIEFEDCNNVKVPIDSVNLVNQLIDFKSKTGQTPEEQVKFIENIIDSAADNPDWDVLSGFDFDPKLKINKDLLRKIPLVIVSSILSPKNLLPLFVMLDVIQNQGINTYNQAVTSGNTYITQASNILTSATTINSQINNIIVDSTDFLKKFKKFNIEVTSKIGAIFTEELFQILKRDIVKLIGIVIRDISTEQIKKKYDIYLTYIQLAIVILQAIDDYRRCKSLLDNIQQLLSLINRAVGRVNIPLSLVGFSSLLPGTSPTRSTINGIKILQSLGIPTGPLPDGSVNLMNLYMKAINTGSDEEKRKNGKTIIAPDLLKGGPPFYVGKDV